MEAAMAEETQFAIGMKASCADGPCGQVRRIVIDPAAGTITHLVIGPEHGQQLSRLVPVDLVGTAAGEIRLSCTIAEFGDLDPAEERQVAEPAGVEAAPATSTLYTGIPRPERILVKEVVPAGEAQLQPGDHVHALDGEIGQVEGFLVDPGDRHVTHVLLKEGHLWGRKEVAIPVSAVTGAEDGIRLNMTKKQVEDLPPAH
jgi:sporulation protein YlmC with PRC-barrel domain